ncbi:MAG: FAD-dependent oxidoreductase [Thermaerobacter sp.]|nr:FAD-dependent oxidoreductase [Thermaerobacter sp.]
MAEMKHFVILGAGPGGMAAAVRAVSQGHRVTVFDPEGWGGNAVNHSLVPSKALLQAAQVVDRARGLGAAWDISRWAAVMQDQTEKIARLRTAAANAARGAVLRREAGRLVSADGRRVRVQGQETGAILEGDVLIVAVGSRQRLLPGLRPDGRTVLVPRALASLKAVPETLDIVGGGATGLETASLFSRLGTATRLHAASPTLLPGYSGDINRLLLEAFRVLGVDCRLGRLVTHGTSDGKGVDLAWTEPNQGSSGRDRATRVFLATGRAPMDDAHSWEALGFALTPEGFLQTSSAGETSVPGVFAVGDARGDDSSLQANRAMMDAEYAVATALGVPFSASPVVQAIFTWPEVARVGETTGQHVLEARLDPVLPPLLYQPVLGSLEAGRLRVYANADEDVVGGEAIGLEASAVMNVVALAVGAGVKVDHLRRVGYVTPSMSEWLKYLVPVAPQG